MKRREFLKRVSILSAAVSLPAGWVKISGFMMKQSRQIKIPLKKFRISDIYKRHNLGG